MAVSERLALRIAAIGAGAALGGAVFGAAASILIADRSLDHDRQVRLQDRRNEVYGRLLGVVQRQKAELDSLALNPPSAKLAETKAVLALLDKELTRYRAFASELAEPIGLIYVFGSGRAISAATDLQFAMENLSSHASAYVAASLPRVVEADPAIAKQQEKGLEEARDKALAAVDRFLQTMRADIGPDGFN